MKKLIVTTIAVAAFSASVFAQGTITIDNLNGAGGNNATNFGLFFGSTGVAYSGATVNITVMGGASAASMAPIATLSGANAMVSFGGGVYVDPNSGTYTVAGVAAGASATLQVQAWIGSANSYGTALGTDQFWAWNGSAFADPSTVTFLNGTGGPTSPPSTPKSLDGMPALQLSGTIVPEPTTLALAGLGAAALLMYRRRNN